jgi:putative oxidoreductase
MRFRDTLRSVNSVVERVAGSTAFIAPLVTRIVVGLAFFHTGTGKFRNFENVIGFFDSLGIPFPAFNAGLVASMETIGGIMLIVGLFTRFFAGGLSITMVVALLTADTADFLASWGSTSELSPTDVSSFTFLLFLLWLVFCGAGNLSFDALLRKLTGTEPTHSGSPGPGSS